MKNILYVFAMLLVGISTAWGQEQSDINSADTSRIRQIISEQMEAFQQRDEAKAFSYASPNIRKLFQRPDIFMRMVETGYKPVFEPQTVEFLTFSADLRGLYQDVYVLGRSGASVVARYYMVQIDELGWKIDGVVMIKSDDLST